MGRTRDVSKILTSNTSILTLASASATYAPVAAGGLVLLSTTTIGTAISSITLTNVFNVNYDNYQIFINDSAASGDVYLTAILGSTTTGYYETRISANIPAGTIDNNITNNGSSLRFGNGNLTPGASINMLIRNPFLSRGTQWVTNTYGATQMAQNIGLLNNTTSYTGMTITVNAGTITGGTITVYGYKK